ncbi:efflux RND transporter periplasmic adaptor subunit [Agaribacterium haliotis]|uniref:efflux RND transporter periplasmic adaptor subunit n=1 Tax=Agaribacterium haliotis TaxID=2013869 RepID=UPI000BB58741|nr:efflux RND transporter periplasmic adaptor subunit [Agaribacterium haliotis]
MKTLPILFPNKRIKKKELVYVALFSQMLFFSISPLNVWSKEDHDHEHERSEQHALHHEEGDHDEHEHEHEHEGLEDHDGGHGHDHGAHAEEDEHRHGEANSSRIEDSMAKQVGIVTSMASSQELHQTITVYGAIVSAPEQLSHVRARFEGMVKSVKVTLGDRVKTSDVLAEIESNESLKTYAIRSPIAGRIVQRHANTGEVTKDQVLFSIANFDTVWAELRVYPAQQSSVTEGQSVHVQASNASVESTVDHIVPSMESPYLVARVELANNNHGLSPGSMVEAHVETGRFSVPLAVVKDAVQTLGGRQGVFVKAGDEYRFTPLVLGRSDDHFYEVIDGLEANSHYVSENSYLVKADIEKSEAGHEH